MVNYGLLIIGLLFCVMILVELIFNFTGIIKDGFKLYEKANNEYFTNNTENNEAIESFDNKYIMKYNGDTNSDEPFDYIKPYSRTDTFRVNILDEILDDNIYNENWDYIDSFKIYTINIYNKDGHIYKYDSSKNQLTIGENSTSFQKSHLFNMYYIRDKASFNTFIPGQIHNTNDYKFYIIKPYNSDKFISYDNVLKVSDVFDIKKCKFSTGSDNRDDGNLTINLNMDNIKNTIIDKLKDIDICEQYPNQYSNIDDCPKYEHLIPKKAVRSLCLNCDPDLIQ